MTKVFKTIVSATLCFFGAIVGGIVIGNVTPSVVRAASDIISFPTIPVSTGVWVGKDLDTTLIATNTARVYLEIGNSGATSTATTLYCNVNGAPAVLYSGFTILASSTKSFSVDNLYTGALHCKAQGASTTVSLIER